jgi:hypothetical protein
MPHIGASTSSSIHRLLRRYFYTLFAKEELILHFRTLRVMSGDKYSLSYSLHLFALINLKNLLMPGLGNITDRPV